MWTYKSYSYFRYRIYLAVGIVNVDDSVSTLIQVNELIIHVQNIRDIGKKTTRDRQPFS